MTEREIKLIESRILTAITTKADPYVELDDNKDIALCIELFDSHEPDIEKIKKWFTEEISNKNAENIELLLLFLSHYGIQKHFIDILARLLIEDWHTCHEDIAFYLEQAKDPSTVKYLYDAATIDFDYLDYQSDYRELSRKCMYALYCIGNEEAIGYIKSLSEHENKRIADLAKEFLSIHETDKKV